jgi:hypothetical protein
MRRYIERLNGWRGASICRMCDGRCVYRINDIWRMCYKCDAPPDAQPSWYVHTDVRPSGEVSQ